MKWIVNPTLINKMRGTKFTILQFSVEYFNEIFSHVPNVYQIAEESLRLFTSHIVNPTLMVPELALVSTRTINPDGIPRVYLVKSHEADGNGAVINIEPDDNFVTMVTFESLDSDIIKVYMLFIQQEDDKPDMPDTRIIGLIQSKTTYTFDVNKLVVGHPYRVRFLEDIDIFDNHYKYGDEIYAILAEADTDSIKFATIWPNVGKQGSNIAGAFQLLPDMKFELDKLV